MAVRGVRIILAAVAIAAGMGAGAARADRFVVMDGPGAGSVLDTRHLTGELTPTDPSCPTYHFHGRLHGSDASTCVLPVGQLPRVFSLLSRAMLIDEAILASSDFRRLDLARSELKAWHRTLTGAASNGRISGGVFDEETADYDAVRSDQERARRAAAAHHDRQASSLIEQALSLQHRAFAGLPADLIGGLVTTMPTTGSPISLGHGSASAVYRGMVAITNALGRTEEACAFLSGLNVHCDATSPSEALAIGAGGFVGGVQSGHAFVSDPLFHTRIVGPRGEIFAGSPRLFVGEEATRHGQRAGTFRIVRRKRLTFTSVGHFPGASVLFTVSGRLAFGDAARHGSVGGLLPFGISLKTGRVTKLFAPLGGSAAPTASNTTGLAAGTSGLLSGRDEGTFWWRGHHYLPFASAYGDTLIVGLNNAGVAVGALGNPAHFHAALFEFGHAYDLNTLIPPDTGWTLTQANAIDDHGRIVGSGFLNGQQHAFELTLR